METTRKGKSICKSSKKNTSTCKSNKSNKSNKKKTECNIIKSYWCSYIYCSQKRKRWDGHRKMWILTSKTYILANKDVIIYHLTVMWHITDMVRKLEVNLVGECCKYLTKEYLHYRKDNPRDLKVNNIEHLSFMHSLPTGIKKWRGEELLWSIWELPFVQKQHTCYKYTCL